jgi:D-alanyl-D-alanine carboxypeptidase
MFKKVVFLSAMCVSALAFSQQNIKQKLGNYIDSLYAHHKVSGSFAIAENGNFTFQKAVGFADAEKNSKANINTQYRVGSVTKIFTAVLMMKAVEEKKISLDQKLSEFITDIPNGEKITLEQLLQHRSGIHNLTDEPEFWQYYTTPKTSIELIGIIKKYKSDFEPGSKHDYSNSNYILLGIILEKIYKTSYADLLEAKITKPLRLKLTKIGGTIDSSKNQAKSFYFENGKYIAVPESDMSIPIGAGNIVSTPMELIKFIQALENGKFVTKESLSKMKSFVDDYGYGLVHFPYEKTFGYGHTGGIDNFRTALFYFPELKVAVAYVANQTTIDTNEIFDKMIDVTQGKDFKMPNFNSIVSEEELQKYIGVYSSKGISLKINIFIKDKELMAQATGQSAFPLDAVSKTSFTFNMANITIDFEPEKNLFVIEQGGVKTTFIKE